MPRKARRQAKNQPHHIMSRSIPELDLFNCNEDKELYMNLIKASAQIHGVAVLAYCLMDKHVHLLVHMQGGSIGKFMKKINNPFAKHYNRTYGRRGHLFAERYKNIVIEDEVQLLRTSTYIHNNAKDLLWQGYRTIEDYPYSSIKDYIRPSQGRGLVDTSYIFNFMSGQGADVRNHYMVLLELQSQGREAFEREMKKAFTKGSYESDKKAIVRDKNPKEVITALSELLKINNSEVRHLKYSRKHKKFKCLLAISLRMFCEMTLKDMTKEFRGYTSSAIGNYSRAGYGMIEEDPHLFDQLLTAMES